MVGLLEYFKKLFSKTECKPTPKVIKGEPLVLTKEDRVYDLDNKYGTNKAGIELLNKLGKKEE